MTTCSQHAGARAAWRCENCRRSLCPDCAAHSGLVNTNAVLCVHCGGLAQKLMVPRPRKPYWQMFPVFLKAIFSLEGAIQILAVAVVMVLLGMIPLLGPLLSRCIFIGYYFRVIMQATYGAERLPEPGDFTDIGDLLGPVFRFFLASLVIWLPAVLYVFLVARGQSDFQLRDLSGTVIFLLISVGVLYFPAAVIIAAISDSALSVINPVVTVRMIMRFPGEYLLTVAIWGFLNVLDGLLWFKLVLWSNTLHIPIFVPILVTMVGLVIPIFTAFIMGRLIYQNAEHFQLLGKEDMEDPEWPDATPCGTRSGGGPNTQPGPAGPGGPGLPWPDDDQESAPHGPGDPLPAAAPEPIDLPDDELEFDPMNLGGQAGPAIDLPPPDRITPGEVDPAVAGDGPGLDLPPLDLEEVPATSAAAAEDAEPAGEPDSPPAAPPAEDALPAHQTMEERLQAAVRDDRPANALKAYQAIRRAGIHPGLPPRLDIRLAGFLEKVGQHEEAVISCQRAAKADMKGPFAARAIFTAARLLADKLDNADRALELYRYVVDNFPQDELSMYAADAVTKLERR